MGSYKWGKGNETIARFRGLHPTYKLSSSSVVAPPSPPPKKKKRTRSLSTIIISDCRLKQLGDLSALDHDGTWIMQLSSAGEMSAAFSHGPMSATTLRVSC